uniref:Uncharacterized protein n=1 Tax=viral metagenome TaxID=1070528 RepID=A0A6C0AUK9_9ZZZZ
MLTFLPGSLNDSFHFGILLMDLIISLKSNNFANAAWLSFEYNNVSVSGSSLNTGCRDVFVESSPPDFSDNTEPDKL